MARLKVGNNIQKYISFLERIQDATVDILGHAIYDGAAIVTDKIRTAISAVPIESSTAAAKSGKLISGLSAAQKGGLLKGLGITTMSETNGMLNVKVGFDGYNTVKNKNWPKGQPNMIIARAMETGTSFRAKNPVITNATKAAKTAAEIAMAEALDREMAKLI